MSDGTQMNGSLDLPKFEDRLWEELAAAHAAEAVGGKRSAGPIPLSGSSGRTRSRLLVAAAVLAIGALVGVGALAATRDSDGAADVAAEGDDGAPADPAASSEDSEDAAAGTGEPESDEAPDDDWDPMIVSIEQENTSGGNDRRWEDEGSAAFRNLQLDEAGNPVYDSAWMDLSQDDEGGWEVSVRTVDHRDRTWYDEQLRPSTPDDIDLADQPSPRQTHEEQLASGWAVDDGLEEIDGVELLRVVDATGGEYCGINSVGDEVCELQLPGDGPGPPPYVCPLDSWGDDSDLDSQIRDRGELSREEYGDLVDDPSFSWRPHPELCALEDDLEMRDPVPAPDEGVTWLDPDTYRPVLRHERPGSEGGYVQRFEYLERTEENLALLEPEIPEGFTGIDPADAAGDGEFVD